MKKTYMIDCVYGLDFSSKKLKQNKSSLNKVAIFIIVAFLSMLMI